MKKTLILITTIILTLFASTSFAYRGRSFDIKLGFFNPDDAKTGFMMGGRIGSRIDERMNIGLSLDYYHKGYNISSKEGDIAVVEAKFSSNMMPIMLDIEFNLPLLEHNREILPFAHVGLGYEILWNSEEYPDQDDKTRTYTGFGWLIGGGIMYKIGYNSNIILELFYNHCTMERDEGKNEIGWLIKEMDMSGLGARVGFRVKSF